MRAEEDAIFAFRMPLHNHIAERYLLSALRVPMRKRLVGYLRAQVGKMFLQHLLLALHTHGP
jgi:hypothetical protein